MISEDEFGRCFEVGEAASKAGRPKVAPYKDPDRIMAWGDGYAAAEVEAKNPDLQPLRLPSTSTL